jgi:hypothetical protein
MRKMMMIMLAAFLPGAALAAPACKVPAGWTKPVAHRAAASPDMKFALQTGQAVRLSLLGANTVKLAAASAHKAKPNRAAGLAALDVPRAGTLSVALSTATYVDLVRDGTIIKTSGFSDNCGAVRKTVRFPVTPGRYIVQLTDAPTKTVTMQATIG